MKNPLFSELETAEWRMKYAICYRELLKKSIYEKGLIKNKEMADKLREAERDAEEKEQKYRQLKSTRCKDTAK